MSSPQARRRQRSTRLTVAVVLIVFAALAVAGAVLSGSWLPGHASLPSSGWCSAPPPPASPTPSSCRPGATPRATGPSRPRPTASSPTARSAEHAKFAATMQSRLDGQEHALAELEVALGSAQKRAADATRSSTPRPGGPRLAEREGRDVAARLEEAESACGRGGRAGRPSSSRRSTSCGPSSPPGRRCRRFAGTPESHLHALARRETSDGSAPAGRGRISACDPRGQPVRE